MRAEHAANKRFGADGRRIAWCDAERHGIVEKRVLSGWSKSVSSPVLPVIARAVDAAGCHGRRAFADEQRARSLVEGHRVDAGSGEVTANPSPAVPILRHAPQAPGAASIQPPASRVEYKARDGHPERPQPVACLRPGRAAVARAVDGTAQHRAGVRSNVENAFMPRVSHATQHRRRLKARRRLLPGCAAVHGTEEALVRPGVERRVHEGVHGTCRYPRPRQAIRDTRPAQAAIGGAEETALRCGIQDRRLCGIDSNCRDPYSRHARDSTYP